MWPRYVSAGTQRQPRWRGPRPTAALLPAGGAVAAQAEPTAHDLAGQVQDGGVAVQDEVGVGGQDDPVQLEGEVTVAFLVALGAAESGRPTAMFQAK